MTQPFQKLPLTTARGLNLDIDGWLRGIGLGQYAQTFRHNAIDADVLRDLTDEHLRELGLPLGARLKLLAVAALSTGQTPTSPEIKTPVPRTDAERRQLVPLARSQCCPPPPHYVASRSSFRSHS